MVNPVDYNALARSIFDLAFSDIVESVDAGLVGSVVFSILRQRARLSHPSDLSRNEVFLIAVKVHDLIKEHISHVQA